MMLALRLPSEIEKRLADLAHKTGRTKTYYARKAILSFIGDMEDTYLSIERLESPTKTWTQEDLEAELDFGVSYGDIRKNLKKNFDRVCVDHTPLLVTRKKGGNVVVISEDDFQSIQETAYLCQSPKNLSRLLESLDRKNGHSLKKVKNELGI